MTKIAPIPVWLLLCLFSISHATERVASPALPQIASSLGIADNLVQLSSSVYFAGFALGIITIGRISDLVGRRPMVLIGISLYCIASIMCSNVTNIYALLACRFFQALGVSVGSVLAQAMARDSFEGKDLAQVFVGVALSLSFIPSIGLVIGGYLTEYIGWSANFWMLGIFGIILLGLCGYYLPETNKYIGIAGNFSYFHIFTKVITDKKVVLYALIVGCVNGMAFGFYVEAPFICIEYFKISPSEYGLVGVSIAGANFLGGIINRFLVKKHVGSYLVIACGIFLTLSGSIIMFIGSFFLSPTSTKSTLFFVIMMPCMVQAVGNTFTIPHILHFALENYKSVSGSAGAIFGSLYYLIIAIVSYMISSIHGTSIISFTTLFLGLSIASATAFLIVRMIVLEQSSGNLLSQVYDKNKKSDNTMR